MCSLLCTRSEYFAFSSEAASWLVGRNCSWNCWCESGCSYTACLTAGVWRVLLGWLRLGMICWAFLLQCCLLRSWMAGSSVLVIHWGNLTTLCRSYAVQSITTSLTGSGTAREKTLNGASGETGEDSGIHAKPPQSLQKEEPLSCGLRYHTYSWLSPPLFPQCGWGCALLPAVCLADINYLASLNFLNVKSLTSYKLPQ